MAFPTVLINSATGSDTTASGAGPGTAISGSTGRTRNTASQLHFGFFGATDDFSGVAVDGSAVCFMSISTAGARNFSSIAAIKNTRETGSDAAITATTAILVVGSTTGWTAGDVLKVTGAGAAGADLYSTILTVDSGIQATLNDNAGTTVAAAAWENPKQATLTTSQGVNTGATNTAWAVGGKRASGASTTSIKLTTNNSSSGDAMPGWIIEFESGHTETVAAAWDFRRAGNTTDGPIIFRGTPGAATLPILTFSNNGNALVIRADGWWHQYFELRNTNATKTASVAYVAVNLGSNLVQGLKVSHSTNKFWKGIGNGTQTTNLIARDCEVGYTASFGIALSDAGGSHGGPQLLNNYIHDTGSDAINFASATWFGTIIVGNIIYNSAGHGIVYDNTRNDNLGSIIIEHNTVDLCAATKDAIRIVTAGLWIENATIRNNLLTNCGGYGIDFVSATFTANYLNFGGIQVSGNNTYNNSSGAYNPSGYGLNDPGLNPTYTAASTGNFTPTNTSLSGKSIPIGGTTYLGTYSTSYTYLYPGAVQPIPPTGGGFVPQVME